MLRAALIGFGQTGKTTLFQLMTSAREAARAAHGKGEATIGISKVPDARLDRLTAMYNPRKRVPATIEFSDLATPVRAGGAQALVDVAAYKNADALVHVLRAFEDPAVPHPSGSIDPARDAQAMEDELILADLGVAERRLERLEKDLKKSRSADLERERDVVTICRARARRGTPAPLARFAGRRPQAAARLSVSLRQTAADRRQPRRGAALAAAPRRASTGGRRGRPDAVSVARRHGGGGRLREDRARNRPARTGRRGGLPVGSGPEGIGARSRHPRQLRSARVYFVLHGRRRRMPRLVDSARHARAAGGRRDSQRHRPRLHPRRGRRLRSP